ncbi:MAG: oxygenase MpaB family protein [Gammaproteobacteria bacterium]
MSAHIEPVTPALFDAQIERLRRECRDPQLGVFGPGSMMWEINKYPFAAMQGAGRALLLQIAHPWITNAIDEHSKTREDPVGRGNRTFTHVGRMVFGSLDQAIESAYQVYHLHSQIRGKLVAGSKNSPAGSDYLANEVQAAVWVHATLWDTSAMMYEMFVRPLSHDEKERYYQETRRFAWMFGIPDEALPKDWDDFMAYNRRMWEGDELQVNANTKELAGFLFKPKQKYPRAGMKWITLVSAVTMPEKVGKAFGLVNDEKTRRRVERVAKVVRAAHRYAPERLMLNPTYVEAQARLAGRRADWLTRRLQKVALGREELVGIEG